MNETEYIILRNRFEINHAIAALRNVIAGKDFFVDKYLFSKIMSSLHSIELTLLKEIDEKITEG